MLTALVAISLFSQPTAIEFDHPGAPVSRAVEAMGKAYGVEMTADPTMKRDFVILALRSETAERARELLAKALNATWTQKEGKWALHRTAAQEREDEHKEVDARAERIRDDQKSIKVPPRVTGKVAEDYIRKLLQYAIGSEGGLSHELNAQTPLSRSIVRLHKEFDARMLAGFPDGTPVILGNRNTIALRRMPAKALEIIREGIEDQNALNQLIGARAATIPPYWQLSPVVMDASRILVKVYGNAYPAIELSVPVRDGTGNLTVSDIGVDSQYQVPIHAWPMALEAPLELAVLSKEHCALRGPTFGPDVVSKIPSRQLLDVYFDHKTHDVNELTPSDIVRQAADAEKKSYVVVPRESATSLAVRLSLKPNWTISEAIASVMPPILVTVHRDGSSVTMVPRDPWAERRTRFDREKFAIALRSMLARDGRVLDTVANAVEGLNSNGVASVLSRLSLLSRCLNDSSYSAGKELLVLYAELTAGQRSAVSSGGLFIDCERLSATSMEALRALVTNKVRNSSAGYIGVGGTTDAENARIEGESSSASNFTARTRFVLRLKSERVLYRLTKAGGQYSRPYPGSPEGVASFSRFAEFDPDLDIENILLRAVSQQVLSISAVSDDGEMPFATYYVPMLYEGDQFEALDKMPAWVRERYAAEIKRIGNIPPRLGSRPRASSAMMGL